MEYYKNEVHIIKYYNGGEPKKIMLSKKRQLQKTTYYTIQFMWNIQKRQICRETK